MPCLLTVLLLVSVQLAILAPTAMAGSTSTFSDGEADKTFEMGAGGKNATATVTVPADATLTMAKVTVSTVEGEPMLDPELDVGDDGSLEWAFRGTGYGEFGHQTEFKDGTGGINVSMRKDSTASGFDLLVPKDADISSASLDLKFQSRDTYLEWKYEGLGIDIYPDTYTALDFGDLDDDGDLDTMVGAVSGLIYYYENDGDSGQHSWADSVTVKNMVGNDIDVGYSSDPILEDMDNDGDLDMIIGDGDGRLTYYENTGNASEAKWLSNNTLFGNADIGSYNSPALADINNDGDLDLFCGEYWGRVALAENTGTATDPIFDHNAGNWIWAQDNNGNIDVGYYAEPELADLDGDNDYDLFIGNWDGYIVVKENIGTAIAPNLFHQGDLESIGNALYVDYYAEPAFADLDGDLDLDLAVGAGFGNVYYWTNEGTVSLPDLVREAIFGAFDFGDYGVPTLGDLDGDGDLDLIIGNETGSLFYLENTGNATDPGFVLNTSILTSTRMTGMAAPQLVDYEGDGDLDLMVGNSTGIIRFYRNLGNANNPAFVNDNNIFGNADYGTDIRPYLADLDGDGDHDLTTTDRWWTIRYYENTGSVEGPSWSLDSDVYDGIDAGSSRGSPLLFDFDGDKDYDLFFGNYYGSIKYYENTGGVDYPTWSITGSAMSRLDSTFYSAPAMGDLDGDGLPDLVMSNLHAQLLVYKKGVVSDPYHFEVGIAMSGGGTTKIWEVDGEEPVVMTTIDFTQALRSQLPVTPSQLDLFGNRMTTMELKVSVADVKAFVTLEGLDIAYGYSVETKDFKDALQAYLQSHWTETDSDGNIAVPMAVASKGSGAINISDIAIQYDTPPRLVEQIPAIGLDEETSNETLLDLHAYFEDAETSDALIQFDIEEAGFNTSIIGVSIFNNKYLSVDAKTSPGSANWTGSATVVVSARDQFGHKVISNGFKVTVKDVNDPPVITSSPVIELVADHIYKYDMEAFDVDEDDQLVYSLAIAPDGMNINPFTGLITWMPTNAEVGIHPVRAVVSDGEGNVTQSFSVTVIGNLETNHPPVFTSEPGTLTYIGATYEYDADATDSDPSTVLRFELVVGHDQMTFDEGTGLLRWTDIIRPHIGKHPVSIKVTDGVHDAYQNFTLVVSQDPKDNKPPEFVTEPVNFAVPNEPYAYIIIVSDPDSIDQGNLEITIEQAPDGMRIEEGKTLTWNPTITDMGEHLVILMVKDLAGATAKQSFNLNVLQISGEPAVLILSPEDGEKVDADFKVVGTLEAKYRQAIKKVEIRIDSKQWKEADGTETWSYDVKDMTPGRHTIDVRAYDGKNYTATASIAVHVKEKAVISGDLEGAMGIIALLVMLIVVMALVGFILGRQKGRKAAAKEAQEEKGAEADLTPEAEEVRAKERAFKEKVYEGRDMAPELEDAEESGFRGAPPAYHEEPTGPEEASPEEIYDPGPGPEHAPSTESGPEPVLEPEPEPEPEPVPKSKPARPEPGPPKDKRPKKEAADADTALDDILKKLQS
jgi:hypothetical protein